MPSAAEIVTFDDRPPPAGHSPFVAGTGSGFEVQIVEADPAWPQLFEALATRIRRVVGEVLVDIQHVGSTAVPELAAKPIIDLDLAVVDPRDEAAYLPALETAGFELRVREPWWYEHRMLRTGSPRAHLHVFGPESPELVRHRIFRDWLRANPGERELYAEVKRAAAGGGGDMTDYNGRKQDVVRAIYRRAFAAGGLLPA